MLRIATTIGLAVLCGCGSPVSTETASGGGKGPGGIVLPSDKHPGAIPVEAVPQFVAIGFDDNRLSGAPGSGGFGGMTWALDLFERDNADGSEAGATFYVSTGALEDSIEAPHIAAAWRRAIEEGHEIGNHTRGHLHGLEFSEERWHEQIGAFEKDLLSIGIDPSLAVGFRAPFLEYNDAALGAVASAGLLYDCSIEEGFQGDQDGTDFLWPYTLDEGSPGHRVLEGWGSREPISPRPGLWEMPAYAVIVPDDDACERYGVARGLRERLGEKVDYFDPGTGKITGFDYNLWVLFDMSPEEFTATLKHTLDLRLRGNRAPFLFGAHSDMYSDKYDVEIRTGVDERRRAVEEFVEYALEDPRVRVVPVRTVLDWMRAPSAL